MKKLSLILLLLLFATTVFASGTVWFQGSFDEAKQKAVSESKLILVDFVSHG